VKFWNHLVFPGRSNDVKGNKIIMSTEHFVYMRLADGSICGYEAIDLNDALKFVHTARAATDDFHHGELYFRGPVHHVTISSEVADSVTKLGVDVTDDTYNWKKRKW